MILHTSRRPRRQLTEPVVHPEVGDDVPHGNIGESEALDGVCKAAKGKSKTDIAVDDVDGLLVVEDGAAGVVVVHTAESTVGLALATALTLTLVEVVSSDIGHKVVGPANKLLGEKVESCENGSLLGKLMELVSQTTQASGLRITVTGEEDHITLHVAGSLVVGAVVVFPAEVGDEKSRVNNPAGEVVDQVGVGEGAVATLVGNDPETSANKTLDNGVDSPESGTHWLGGDVLGSNKVVVNCESGCEKCEITQNVGVASQSRAVEAMLGNGIANVLDGEVRRTELIAVGVNETTIVGLGLVGVCGRKRGERSRRG